MLSPCWKKIIKKKTSDLKLWNDGVCLYKQWLTSMYVEFVLVLLSTESALIWILKAGGASMNTRQLWVLEAAVAALLIGFSMSPDGENSWTSHSWRKIHAVLYPFRLAHCLIAPYNENSVIICSPYVLSNPYDFLCSVEQLLLNVKEQFGDSARYTTSQMIFSMFLEKVSCAHQGSIYLIKKTVILFNIILIKNDLFLI